MIKVTLTLSKALLFNIMFIKMDRLKININVLF